MIWPNAISIKHLGYLFITLIGLVFIFNAVHFEPHDFANYYFGATFLKEGNFSSLLYFPHKFNQEIATLGYKNIFCSYAPNPPFLATFFMPFTFVSLKIAKIIFNLISLLLFLYSLQKLFKIYAIKHIFLFLIPIVFLIPFRNNFLFGQIYLLLFFLLSEGFLAFKRKSYIKMGVFWGIAIMLKIFPIILLFFLLFKKQYRALIYLFSTCIFLLSISLIINGSEVWEFYLKSVLIKSSNGEISRDVVLGYQSIFMFLKKLFLSNTTIFSISLLLSKLILIVISYFFTKNETSELNTFSFWIFLSILLSPYGSTYTSILLIFLFIYYVKEINPNFKLLFVIFLFFLISNTPIHYFLELPIPFSFPRLFLLLILFIFLVSKNFNYIHRKSSIVFISFFLLIALLTSKNDIQNGQVLVQDQPILVYDYVIEKSILNYIYWNKNGKQMESTGLAIKNIDTSSTTMHNNQIYYKGKQITFNDDNKLKPSVVNQEILIYLSDLNQGIGFYQLRSIPLTLD
ncbi:glycosyltransferase family 87 protein [uncultured Aquimarina sp.]|uniref:glycosyltransferase family 87 protein n=2 Tax=uncultured Aquimarina sp. TaxID=575652 RepID=UPI0026142B2E|nr:glycosyltransferase family 87 protein [uncultured Aquimarina sp.]